MTPYLKDEVKTISIMDDLLQVKEIRGQLKAQQQLSEGGHEDPDSRMETDRERRAHIDKKSAKGKGGLRGSGTKGFWRN